MTSNAEREPSLSNPTWEYLNEKFKKTQLQKICMDMGITKVWVNKNELINKMLEKHQSSTAANENNEESINPNSPIDLTSEVK